MLALPTTDWRSTPLGQDEVLRAAPQPAAWRSAGAIEHVFTHFALTLEVWRAEASSREGATVWLPVDEAARALPSVFLKALRRGLEPSLI
jgi:A/G-specific adenine glycosylase